MRLSKWFKSTPVIVLLALVLIGMSILEFSQWRKRSQIQKEIDLITKQQSDYEQKNKDLADSLSLLNTQNYKEKIAREQLNLKKDGEIVINFSGAEGPQSQDAAVKAQTNPQKWWQYFFNKN